MELISVVRHLSEEALKFVFADALNRGDDLHARIISDELFARKINGGNNDENTND